MFNPDCAVDGKKYILYHLTGIYFGYKDSFFALSYTQKFFFRKRPEGYGTEQSHLDALYGGNLDCFLGNTGGTAEGGLIIAKGG